MQLTKYEALGNDFLVAAPEDFPVEAVPLLCDRRRGLGADGVLVVAAWGATRLFNADGSPAGFSGNGARCAGLHLALERQEVGAATVQLDFGGRAMTVEVAPEGEGDGEAAARAAGRSSSRQVSLTLDDPVETLRRTRAEDLPLGHDPYDPPSWFVDVGNPHLVLLGDDPSSPPPPDALEALRRGVPAAPGGVNVTWLCPLSADAAVAFSHERGVGPTPACASGAMAAFFAAQDHQVLGPEARLNLPGGTLLLRGDRSRVRCSSEVRRVYEARVP